jgi:hypothetical protein
LSSVLRPYSHAEEGILEEVMEVVTLADMVITQVAREDIMEAIPAISMDGLQAARRRVAIS